MTLLSTADPRSRRPPDGRMALVEHLRELRNRLAISLVAIAVGVVVAYYLWQPIYDFLREPYCRTSQSGKGCNLYALGIFDQFKVRLRVAFIGGTILASPIWLYELGAFITPALHKKERRYAAGFLVSALLLFLAGTVLAYLSISRGLQFFLTLGGSHIAVILSIQAYLSFVTLMLLAFGIAFEFPVVILFLNVVGVLSAARMREWRRGMIFGIFVASALITPTQDPFTFLAMAIPLCVLYEVCIVIARLRERSRRRLEANDPLASLDPDTPSYVDPRPSSL
ncbi:MAG: Sec-independent protein translocase, TatC subunit [Frankiales bacterium]|nr:Sec-independent protein translocase, TatC subunit [Frankiales bacterium]